jgi:elongation factor P
MKISANEIKNGTILEHEGQLWVVIKNPEHTKPGKGGAYVQVEMKNLRTHNKLNQRFSSSENVEKAFLESKKMQFLYMEGDQIILMDQESFEQVGLDKKMLEEKVAFLTDGLELSVSFHNETPLSVTLPANLVGEIEHTDPIIKGSTVTSSYKPAILTNGLKVMVPPYLSNGEKIVVKTDDLTFVERAK